MSEGGASGLWPVARTYVTRCVPGVDFLIGGLGSLFEELSTVLPFPSGGAKRTCSLGINLKVSAGWVSFWMPENSKVV